jgi:hypothetical protein
MSFTAPQTNSLRRLWCAALVFIVPIARAAVYDFYLGDARNRSLRMNIPDGVPVVRGLLIYGNGAGSDYRNAATAGIAMAEVYDLDATTSPGQFASLSTLGFTGMGENVLTPGFIITGDGPKQLLIRVVGPTLGAAPYNVPGTLADPRFKVIPLNQNFTVASNDNWGGTAALQAAFAQTQAFALPTDSRDAAAIVCLPPGGYTVQATGVGDTTGNVLVEVYDLDP